MREHHRFFGPAFEEGPGIGGKTRKRALKTYCKNPQCLQRFSLSRPPRHFFNADSSHLTFCSLPSPSVSLASSLTSGCAASQLTSLLGFHVAVFRCGPLRGVALRAWWCVLRGPGGLLFFHLWVLVALFATSAPRVRTADCMSLGFAPRSGLLVIADCFCLTCLFADRVAICGAYRISYPPLLLAR